MEYKTLIKLRISMQKVNDNAPGSTAKLHFRKINIKIYLHFKIIYQ